MATKDRYKNNSCSWSLPPSTPPPTPAPASSPASPPPPTRPSSSTFSRRSRPPTTYSPPPPPPPPAAGTPTSSCSSSCAGTTTRWSASSPPSPPGAACTSSSSTCSARRPSTWPRSCASPCTPSSPRAPGSWPCSPSCRRCSPAGGGRRGSRSSATRRSPSSAPRPCRRPASSGSCSRAPRTSCAGPWCASGSATPTTPTASSSTPSARWSAGHCRRSGIPGVSPAKCCPPSTPSGRWSPRRLRRRRRPGRGWTRTAAAEECLALLDAQPQRSIVYLCWGSKGSLLAEQIKEIATGLEMSRQRFLWVVRAPSGADDAMRYLERRRPEPDLGALLPEGFLERTKGLGLVLGSWAPQVEVLNHPAVGAFVTHCGWNSTLEAVAAGVPMLCWPLGAEQKMNKVFVVDDGVGVGVELRGYDTGFVTAEEIAAKVRLVLRESVEGRKLRARAAELKKEAREALSEDGGSSHAAFLRFLSDAADNNRLSQ